MGVNQVERAEKALKVKLKKRPFKIKRPLAKKEVAPIAATLSGPYMKTLVIGLLTTI